MSSLDHDDLDRFARDRSSSTTPGPGPVVVSSSFRPSLGGDGPGFPTGSGEGAAIRRSSRGRTPSGKPNPVDVHVGARVRLRRTLLGLSQEKLGEAIGLTFQQVQKYERGANRIGASRLWDLGRVLDVPMAYFFDEMDDSTQRHSPMNIAQHPGEPPVQGTDTMTRRETLELVRAYYRIGDPGVRRRVFELTKTLAGIGEGAAAAEDVAVQ
ncbi:transcriptional regulator, XRE family [Rhodospirillum rubrum ATCC 11170]|uniref:Transcriptional regulator, XRE family n=1 Tax=Rhodospirillum rubrum (strain ATCC 11170 / ATH 1.1.1 / DSM 467 / LMG 4362 / NCIMB 8255 / S1) TaxID=269796 RepID=Q2RMS6_RHORT|nr:helix-turn-helix transcriptional regulator [Rhodospirillum rubrum]ABC24569.1 transcriptional regulator, XRE family [Rhodospirillum rubrum ATCC 11170]MBK5956301.1 transcriptional regulator [Rhodospirillum rubrum]QXG80483.1 helix-turn-helix domain-containing protein [Rhodospirillum rubrum]HAQ01109.1 XRE family transcriptional regulator [Rhodospirillum rubrum]